MKTLHFDMLIKQAIKSKATNYNTNFVNSQVNFKVTLFYRHLKTVHVGHIVLCQSLFPNFTYDYLDCFQYFNFLFVLYIDITS